MMTDRDLVELVILPPGTKRTAANTHDTEWMPFKPIKVNNDVKGKGLIFSQDENYRAYKFFSIIDFDNAGSIDRRKLFKLLFGDYVNTFTSSFTHQDTGVYFGLDEEDQVCITALEDGSPASLLPTLVVKLRLLRVNTLQVPPLGGGISAVRAVRAAITKVRRGKVTFEFLEPLMSISPFSRYVARPCSSQGKLLGETTKHQTPPLVSPLRQIRGRGDRRARRRDGAAAGGGRVRLGKVPKRRPSPARSARKPPRAEAGHRHRRTGACVCLCVCVRVGL